MTHTQVGGLFGLMEAVESSAGLVGPALGGILYRMGRHIPLVTVVVIYALVFSAIFLYYRDTIVHHKKRKSIAAPVEGNGNKSKSGSGGANVLNEKAVKVEGKKNK